MSMLVTLLKTFGFGKLTQTAGTVISRFIPGIFGLRPIVQKIVFTNSTTAHTLTAMLPCSKRKVSVAAAGADTTFVINADPGDYTKDPNGVLRPITPSVANNLIASGDFIAVKQPDGNWSMGTVSTCTTNSDGTVTVTYTVPTGGFAAGAEVQFFGITTDTNPNTGLAHQQFAGVASDTVVFEASAGVVAGAQLGDGIILQSNNATAAGTIDRAEGGWQGP